MSETDVFRCLSPEKLRERLHDEANKSMRLYFSAIKAGTVGLHDCVVIETPDFARLKRVLIENQAELVNSAEENDDKEK